LAVAAAPPVIRIEKPQAPPDWALAERALLAAYADAAEEFAGKYVDERGYFRCLERWGGNDGPDDVMETFHGWTLLHALGARDSVVELYRKIWEGHIRQFTAAKAPSTQKAKEGMFYKEFVTSFDWEHTGEGLAAFHHYALVADRLVGALADSIPRDRIFRLGSDLAILMPMALDDDSTVGQDRLLAAMGAYSRAGQACVVIDAGTAVTVDFVDGEGTFQGGAIAPGLTMMLDSLHRGTAALPKMEFLVPDPARGVIGKDTRHAMTIGVRAAVTGMARVLIDSYAEVFGAYPQVVATGGDAAIFENDPLVEHIVPDLVLLGIAEACRRTLMDDPQDQVDRERSARAARGGGFESRLGRHEGTSGSEGGSHDDPNPRE
ncbi:MAG TPA: type III pantothenate kinase, partial [Phycisphaerales bacterium]|nr:type III pantothenate kinase [Phycisphaerales bacterium]